MTKNRLGRIRGSPLSLVTTTAGTVRAACSLHRRPIVADFNYAAQKAQQTEGNGG